MLRISIHALLAESDAPRRGTGACRHDFYPRSPCGERRKAYTTASASKYFYPRSPCGERRYSFRRAASCWHFYPRSPCGERRPLKAGQTYYCEFLSTLSLRRATGNPARRPTGRRHFYPRSPCGERLGAYDPTAWGVEFLSTLSLRRATARRASRQQPAGISIHALLAESDNRSRSGRISTSAFLSTLSLRRATNTG